MTNPKAKAREIVELFKPYSQAYVDERSGFIDREEERKNATQCAIIHVEGLIQESAIFMSSKVQRMNYWQEVLQELKQI